MQTSEEIAKCESVLREYAAGLISAGYTYRILKLNGYPASKLSEFADYNSGRN